MGRKKVSLKYIPNEKTRRKTLKNRSNALMKKAGEVAILCNTKACVIVYPEGESIPQVFSSHDDPAAMMNRLRSMNDDDPFNKKMDQECFLGKSFGKFQEQALKSERRCEENDMRILLHKTMLEGLAGLSIEELANVDCKAEVFLKSIRDRITEISGQPPVYLPSQVQAPNPNFTTGMSTTVAPSTYQSQPPTPYVVTNDMGAIGAPTMYKARVPTPYVTSNMDTTGAPTMYQGQTLAPYISRTMDTIRAPTVMHQAKALPQQKQQEWLELTRTGGGDLGAPVCSSFNGGATFGSTAGLNGTEMLQPFDLGAWSSRPWGGADAGPSSSAFPPM